MPVQRVVVGYVTIGRMFDGSNAAGGTDNLKRTCIRRRQRALGHAREHALQHDQVDKRESKPSAQPFVPRYQPYRLHEHPPRRLCHEAIA